MTHASRSWHCGLAFDNVVRASIASLAKAHAHYRRSACGRRHRIIVAPSGFVDSPWSIAMPGSQPIKQKAIALDARPAASHVRTTPSVQRMPSLVQTSGSNGSPGRIGRATEVSERQTFAAPASRDAMTSSPSSTQPEVHCPMTSQGHVHAPRFSGALGSPHG